jgi:hypothetical protein
MQACLANDSITALTLAEKSRKGTRLEFLCCLQNNPNLVPFLFLKVSVGTDLDIYTENPEKWWVSTSFLPTLHLLNKQRGKTKKEWYYE